ncbi:SEC-C metal-binding domain-containing protein [Fulvivirga sp.]|uniref:SEC-C metal-binding domain-containing protein n=1 Tax=Fulvivirga sp. TaxID=1931237 RepID=UPI0032F00D7B
MGMSPEVLSSLQEELKTYESLELSSSNGISISGSIDLVEGGVQFETYDIKLLFPSNYGDFSSKTFPYRYPLVYETSNKIPSNIGHHKSKHGQLCLEIPPRELVICKDGITLTYFIEEILKPHLAIQYVKVNSNEKKYLYAEYDHDLNGYWDYFKEYYQLDDKQLVLKALAYTTYNLSWSKSKPCFCGSERQYSECHMLAVESEIHLTSKEIRRIYFKLKRNYEN